MSIYKVTFAYDGTNFFGWQKQPDQKSIQGEIEKVLRKLSKSQEVQVIGCGRTDAGVHALSQVTRVTIPNNIEPDKFKKGLNSLLPLEIRAVDCEYSNEDFQPVFNAKEKTYRYVFSLNKEVNPFLNNYVTYLGRDLDIAKLNEACELFIGEHDFEGFSTKGTPVKSTTRTITSCRVHPEEMMYGAGQRENVLVFEVIGNGFLKQMVRLLVSAIWSYAEGKIGKEEIKSHLRSPTSTKVAPTAPPNGLYLVNVTY